MATPISKVFLCALFFCCIGAAFTPDCTDPNC